MTIASPQSPADIWLGRFRTQPFATLDELLRGLTRIHPFERATPSETLRRLFGSLSERGGDIALLDDALLAWLEVRWRSETAHAREAYGLSRFVTEVIDALSVIWLLDLPRSGAWLQENFLELARWAAPLRLSKSWDLPQHLAYAVALTQQDGRFRFVWFRMCSDAARPSARSMIAPALGGLGNLPDLSATGASKELIGGLARFGAALPETSNDERDFLRQWRAIKVRYPRASKTWRNLWHEILENPQYASKPFLKWLAKSDPALARPLGTAAASILPGRHQLLAVLSTISEGNREKAIHEATTILSKYEQYAEATGDSDYFVRSACKLADEVLSWAPGHALVWARDAIRWAENYAPSWSLRARALVALGRKDLAYSVLWEAVRRLPGEPFVRTQLALLLEERGSFDEAEALLRDALTTKPLNPGVCVELARLLNLTDRQQEAEDLLRRGIEERVDNVVIPHTLTTLLISWGRREEASLERDRFARRFPNEHSKIDTLTRLLGGGKGSEKQVKDFLLERTYREEGLELPILEDHAVSSRGLAMEERSGGLLARAATVGHADLLFQLGRTAEGQQSVVKIIEASNDDMYAGVVWSLHDPSQRSELAARYAGCFGVLAPHLAAASPTTPEAVWHRLRAEFPEKRPLTEFARVMRGGSAEGERERLEHWLAGETDASLSFLRTRLRLLSLRDGGIDSRSADQRALLDTAIRAEVEVGEMGFIEAA